MSISIPTWERSHMAFPTCKIHYKELLTMWRITHYGEKGSINYNEVQLIEQKIPLERYLGTWELRCWGWWESSCRCFIGGTHWESSFWDNGRNYLLKGIQCSYHWLATALRLGEAAGFGHCSKRAWGKLPSLASEKPHSFKFTETVFTRQSSRRIASGILRKVD